VSSVSPPTGAPCERDFPTPRASWLAPSQPLAHARFRRMCRAERIARSARSVVSSGARLPRSPARLLAQSWVGRLQVNDLAAHRACYASMRR
jgi:hypothetical protein